MNNSLEHLERGYFNCFHETVKATREVLADLNEVDATYIDTVLVAMGKWQQDVTLVIADMHTDDCVVWDAKRNAIDKSTQEFGETCEASCIQHGNTCEACQRAVVEGNKKDPVVELLDWVVVKMKEAANITVKAFQEQFEKALVPCVPAEHLPLLVGNAYNTVSQFRMTIWQMVADECIMSMRHDYLTNFGLATVMQHALEKVPGTCMRIVPPRPPEPRDNLTAFLQWHLQLRLWSCLPSSLLFSGFLFQGIWAWGQCPRLLFQSSGECPFLLYLLAWWQVYLFSKLPLLHLWASGHCQQASVLSPLPRLQLLHPHRRRLVLALLCPFPFHYRGIQVGGPSFWPKPSRH